MMYVVVKLTVLGTKKRNSIVKHIFSNISDIDNFELGSESSNFGYVVTESGNARIYTRIVRSGATSSPRN